MLSGKKYMLKHVLDMLKHLSNMLKHVSDMLSGKIFIVNDL